MSCCGRNMNAPLKRYISPDGALTIGVWRDVDDYTIGFENYAWHTHADLLAEESQSHEEAIDEFIDSLLHDRVPIVISRKSGTVADVWITDDPTTEDNYKDENEELEFRFWSGKAVK